MKIKRIKQFLFSLLFIYFVIQCPQVHASDKVFKFEFPKTIDPENIWFDYGIYHEGLSMNSKYGKKNQWAYRFEVPANAKFKLLIRVSGYKIISVESSSEKIIPGNIYRPQLVPILKVNLAGRLVNGEGVPHPNETIFVYYRLTEAMDFYGYIDGTSPLLLLGSGRTNSDGIFNMSVPYLLDDPFFEKYKHIGKMEAQFVINGSDKKYLDIRGYYGSIHPAFLTFRKEYKNPFIITLIKNARIEGRFSNRYIQENQIKGKTQWNMGETLLRVALVPVNEDGEELPRISLWRDKDGLYFNPLLPPGIYSFYLRIIKDKNTVEKEILVYDGMTLKENGRKTLKF